MDEKFEKLMQYLIQSIQNFNQHAVSIQILSKHLMNPILVDDRGLAHTLREIHIKQQELIESTEKLDIVQILSEIKFIGKRLTEIENMIKDFKQNGFRKQISLEFSCDGYELVKKPREYSRDDPIEESNNDLRKLLDTLIPREGMVLMHYYGLLGTKKKTLKKIGELFELSDERVRQINLKALRKCRHPSRIAMVRNLPDSDFKKAVTGE